MLTFEYWEERTHIGLSDIVIILIGMIFLWINFANNIYLETSLEYSAASEYSTSYTGEETYLDEKKYFCGGGNASNTQ